jgi:hypothetical protein
VRFPNLLAAMAAKGKRHYETARAVRMSESRFSRCLRGLEDFSRGEREKIAEFLGRPARWLFKQIRPPCARKCEAQSTPGEVSRQA